MTKKIILLLILSSLYLQCKKEKTTQIIDSMSITFTIIPEYNDETYYVKWKDTLGQKDRFNQYKRPLEIWCIIKNQKNDTIGHYTGLSNPQKMSNFTTKDSIVNIDFKIGINIFSEFYHEKTEKENKNNWDLNLKRMTHFETIKVNLKKELKKDKKVILKRRT